MIQDYVGYIVVGMVWCLGSDEAVHGEGLMVLCGYDVVGTVCRIGVDIHMEQR